MNKNYLPLLALLILVFTDSSGQCRASFVYTGSGNACGQGRFDAVDYLGNGAIISERASSGNTWAANSSSYVSFKDIGAIPPGIYRINLKDASKNIFSLAVVSVPDMYSRDGFLIHGYNTGQTREEASKGCIILDANQRQRLRTVIDVCKEVELVVAIN